MTKDVNLMPSEAVVAAPKKRRKKIASLDRRKARAGWLFVLPFVLGFVLILPATRLGRRLSRALGNRAAVTAVHTLLVFVLFVFTVFFFLPEASFYDTVPFRYMYI